MAKKRKFRKRKYQARRYFIYVNEDGTQYLADDMPPLQEIPDDRLPEAVEEFTVDIRVLTGQDLMNQEQAAATAGYRMQGQTMAPEQVASASQEVSVSQLVYALASWSLVDEGGAEVPVSRQALSELEPGWLYEAIQIAFQQTNGVSKNWTRG